MEDNIEKVVNFIEGQLETLKIGSTALRQVKDNLKYFDKAKYPAGESPIKDVEYELETAIEVTEKANKWLANYLGDLRGKKVK
ncbi:MAG: hypothetical protein ABIF10_02970 [Candidatus Woesearchaeota archaeon]